MVLTDRQRADLHAGIYEYLQTQEGPHFEAAAAALLLADPSCGSNTTSSSSSASSSIVVDIPDDSSVSSRMSTSSRYSTSSRSSRSSLLPTCKLEKKWTAVSRLQKKVLELERALASSAKMYAHRGAGVGGVGGVMGPGGAMVPTGGAVERRMLPRPPCAHTLKGHAGVVTVVAVHPVFTVAVSASEDGTIKVWDHESGEYVRTLKGHTNTVHSLSFTPTGSHLASSSSDLSIKLWDFTTYTCVRTLRGHDHTISSVVFLPSPPSTILSNNQNGTTNTSNGGTNTNTTNTHNLSGIDSTTAGASYMVSASRDKTVKFWDIETGFCEDTLTDHTDWVRCLAVRSSDGQLLASAGNDQSILVYDLGGGGGTDGGITSGGLGSGGRKQIARLNGHEHVIESVAFMTGPTPALALDGKDVKDSVTKRKNGLTTGVGGGSSSAAATEAKNGEESRKNYLVSGGRDRSVRLWNVLTSQCIAVFKYHENWVRSVVLHPSGKFIISAGDDRTIRVMDIKTNRCIRTITDAHPHFVTSISMHHTLPALISSGVDQTVKCWRLD